MGNTYLDDYVKIDNLVHISHNCHLERGTFVVSGAFLGGGTHTGENCWLAANITVKEQTRINDKALVGLGAVVLKEVEEGAVMIGNPARKLEKH
jgi:UDP-3-O-[3-hydroxymyristoyl] glucosamine N-acyltransferase